jgi:hypothetical protein
MSALAPMTDLGSLTRGPKALSLDPASEFARGYSRAQYTPLRRQVVEKSRRMGTLQAEGKKERKKEKKKEKEKMSLPWIEHGTFRSSV